MTAHKPAVGDRYVIVTVDGETTLATITGVGQDHTLFDPELTNKQRSFGLFCLLLPGDDADQVAKIACAALKVSEKRKREAMDAAISEWLNPNVHFEHVSKVLSDYRTAERLGETGRGHHTRTV